jgi:hypothetical protein
MKAAMPLLRASGNGSVMKTSSVLGLVGSGAAAAYQASKGALRLLSKTAAVEYARDNVRVNSVHPGVIATPMIQDLLDEQGNQQPDIVRTPMASAGRADEVAPVMLFLASDESLIRYRLRSPSRARTGGRVKRYAGTSSRRSPRRLVVLRSRGKIPFDLREDPGEFLAFCIIKPVQSVLLQMRPDLCDLGPQGVALR